MALLALVAVVVLPVTSQQHDCSILGCEADPSFHFQLLQYKMEAKNAQDHSEWIGKGGNFIRSGSTWAVPPVDLSKGPTWTWEAPFGGLVRGSPVVDSKGSIYQSTIAGQMVKFSQTGEVLWAISTGNVSFPGNPVKVGGVLYNFGTDGQMLAVDANDGKKLWQTPACEMASGDTHTIVAGEGVVLASCLSKSEEKAFGSATTIVACNAADGQVMWKYRPDKGLYNWIGSIQYGAVLFSDMNGGVYRLNLKDGSVVWKVPPPAAAVQTTGGLSGADNGLVYVTSNVDSPDGHVGLLSVYTAAEGKPVWQRSFPKFPANSGPAVATGGDTPFVVIAIGTNPGLALPMGAVLDLDPFDKNDASGTQRHPSKAVAMDAKDGHTIWEYQFPDWHGAAAGDTTTHTCLPDSYANPSIAGDGAVFLAGMSGTVYRLLDKDGDGKFDPASGEVTTYDTGNAFQAAPAISEGILAVSPCNGLKAFQRNASVLAALVEDQLVETDFVDGLQWKDLNEDLLLLALRMVEEVEIGADERTQTPAQVTDSLWRQLNLDALDALLLRWHRWRDQQGLPRLARSELPGGDSDLDLKELKEAILRAPETSGQELSRLLVEIIVFAEGLLGDRRPQKRSVLTAKLPAGIVDGEEVHVVVQATPQADGTPSDEVRVSIVNANGDEIGVQRSHLHLLGNADEILRAFSSQELGREDGNGESEKSDLGSISLVLRSLTESFMPSVLSLPLMS
eukprot:s263_g11.t1